jgi:hypothetical protein
VTSGPWFRLAQEPDADLILEFMREYYAFDGHHFDDENSPAAFMGLLRADSLSCIWLIQDGDAAVGYVVLTLGYSLELLGRDASIDEFYLRETYRGRGGCQAIAFVEGAALPLASTPFTWKSFARTQRLTRFIVSWTSRMVSIT